jgi:Cd2+/Zn2+-exporting ATPase
MLARQVTDLVPHDECCDHGHGHDHDHGNAKVNLIVAIVGGILILNSGLAEWVHFYSDGEWVRYYPDPFQSTLSAIIGAIILAMPILVSAAKDVKRGRIYMNELVALALIAAFVMGYYQEAGIIAFFMLIAITIEERTAIGAVVAIEEVLRLTPSTARLVRDGNEEDIAASALEVGNVVRVRPGENFPADGELTNGSSEVNQASITGESMPAAKQVGDNVYAGTENLTGMVELKVTGVGPDTTLGKVRDLIAAAERTRLPIMRMVDRYVHYYTPAILMIAAIVWFFNPDDILRVVLVLVIACPCALIVATPSAAVAAIASASRLGVIIKNVSHIEALAHIRAVVFDKTGTLTEGNLEVARLNPAQDVELSELLEVAVVAESQSNHPAATAMRKLAEEANVAWEVPDKFTEVTGKGVVAEFGNSKYRVGRESWLKEEGLDTVFVAATEDETDSSGMTFAFIAKDNKVLGSIGLRDRIRDGAAKAISELEELGVRQCCMVTGDNQSVAESVGRKVGIREIQAECLPEEKVAFVEKLKAANIQVAVVGDGVNDAPALAAGNIGIAMGAIGSDVAINSASIALMHNDLRRIPFLIALSRKTRAVMNQNLLFGALLIVGGLMCFIFGNELLDFLAVGFNIGESVFKSLLAAFIHILGTLIVVFNSARLVRFGEALESANE